MKTYLRIKGMSLAAEVRILKRLAKARSYHNKLRESIHNHHMNVVRDEARSTNIALGFIRGKDYDDIEQPLRPKYCGHIPTKGFTKTHPNWDRIEQLALKFGLKYFASEQALRQKFSEFRDGGIETGKSLYYAQV